MNSSRKQVSTEWESRQQKEDQRETADIEKEKLEQKQDRTEEQSQESPNRKQ